MRTVYYVAEEDPSKAEAIIAACMAPNEKVEAYGPLPEAAVKAVGLKPGSFKHGSLKTTNTRLPDGARRAECLSRGHDGRTVRLGARNDQVMRRLQSADNEGPG